MVPAKVAFNSERYIQILGGMGIPAANMLEKVCSEGPESAGYIINGVPLRQTGF